MVLGALAFTGCKVGGETGASKKSFGTVASGTGAALTISMPALASSSSNGGSLVPGSLSDFDCFAVNVVASDIKQVPICGGTAKMGVAVGFLGRGPGSIDINVPLGANRTIQIWGFANSSQCGDVTSLVNTPYGRNPAGFNSAGYLLAEKTLNVTSKKMTVDMDLTFTHGVNSLFCGVLPTPSTTIDSGALVPGVEVVTLTDNGFTSNTSEACLRYTTTAISPVFTCYVDGVETTCAQGPCNDHQDGTTSEYGVHRFTIGGSVPAGTHTFTVVTRDNIYDTYDPSPPTFTWTVDTTAPIVTLTGFSPGKLAGGTYYTNSRQPTAIVQTNEVSSVEIGELTLPIASAECIAATLAGVNHGCVLSQSVATGSYSIEIAATNQAGLTTTNAAVALVIDQIRPTVDVSTTWPMGGSFNTGVNATGADTAPGVVDPSTLVCTVDGTTTSSCAPMTFTSIGGKHTVVVNVNDYAANRAVPVTRSVYVDNVTDLPVLGRVKTNGTYYTDESASNNAAPIENLPGDNGLDSPSGSVLDTAFNRLYVSDRDNNRILVFRWDPNRRQLSNHNAIDVIGQTDFYGTAAAAPPTALTLSGPTGLAISADGTKLFVSDTGNNRILIFDDNTSTTIDKTADIALGQPGFITSGANNPGSSTGLNAPQGIYYFEASDRLLVADQNNCRVAAWNSITTIATGAAISYQLGAGGVALGAAITCPPMAESNTTLNLPKAVTVDAGSQKIFVADYDANRIAIWDVADTTAATMDDPPIGQIDTTTATAGDSAASPITNPTGVEIVTDGNNNTYVAVSMSIAFPTNVAKVKFFTISSGTYTLSSTWNTSGMGVSKTAFRGPSLLSFNSDDSVFFVADESNNRIGVFKVGDTITANEEMDDVVGHTDSSGVFTSFTSLTKNNPNELKLNGPTYTVADTTNNRLYVSDTGNNRVLIYQLNATNKRPALAAAFVSLGIPFSGLIPDTTLLNSYTAWPSTISVSNATLKSPKGLTLDADKNLWVVDSGNHRVVRFPTGNYRFTTDSFGKTLPIAADVVLCQSSMANSTSGNGANECDSPTDIVYDATDDYLFVSDSNNDRILYWDDVSDIVAGTTRTTKAAEATVFGDGSCNAGIPNPTCLDNPQGLAFTSGIAGGVTPVDRGLFVADTANHRVVYYDINPVETTADACYGKRATGCDEGAGPALGANGGGTVAANGTWALSSPRDVEIKTSATTGHLYISDYGNGRVAVYDFTNEDNRPADADFTANNIIFHGIGQDDLATASAPTLATADNVRGPTGMFYLAVSGGTNLLYVVDALWHRVVMYEVP